MSISNIIQQCQFPILFSTVNFLFLKKISIVFALSLLLLLLLLIVSSLEMLRYVTNRYIYVYIPSAIMLVAAFWCTSTCPVTFIRTHALVSCTATVHWCSLLLKIERIHLNPNQNLAYYFSKQNQWRTICVVNLIHNLDTFACPTLLTRFYWCTHLSSRYDIFYDKQICKSCQICQI